MRDVSLRWYASYQPEFGDGVKLYLIERGPQKFYHKGEMTIIPMEGAAFAEPALELYGEQAQQIMDELWRIGLRPRNGEGAGAHVAALKEHLTDLRRLVFKEGT